MAKLYVPQPLPLPTPGDWYQEGRSRVTPEGFIETVTARRLDAEKIAEVSQTIIAQAAVDFDAKFDARLQALQLVDAHLGEVLPQVVVDALAAAMSVSGSVAGPREGTDADLLALAGTKMNRPARVALLSIIRARTTALSDDARWAITVALDLHDAESWKTRRYRQGIIEAIEPAPQPTQRLSGIVVDEHGEAVAVWRERRAEERAGIRHTRTNYDAAVEAEAEARASGQALKYQALAEKVRVPRSAIGKWAMTDRFKMAVSTRAYWLIEELRRLRNR